MRCTFAPGRLAAWAFFSVMSTSPCLADSLTNVTAWNSVTLNSGYELIVNFGTWTYSSNNPGYPAVPTSLQFEAYGPRVAGGLSSVPNSSAQYFSGFRVTAYLESADGSVVVPLNDPNATRVGLPGGTLLLTPGTYSGSNGSVAVSMLSATVTLSESTAESLFGPNAAQPWSSDARIVLVNEGNPLSLGLGGSSPIESAVEESGLRGSGPVETGGMTTSVQLDVSGLSITQFAAQPASEAVAPEPGGVYLLCGGMGLLGFGGLLRRRLKLAPVLSEDTISD